jgi:hypothetical protein
MNSVTFGPARLVYEMESTRMGSGDLEANMAKYAHELRGLKFVEFKVYQRGHGETKTPSQHLFYFNITDNAAKMLHQMWFLETLEEKAQTDHDLGLVRDSGKSRYGTIHAEGTGSNPTQVTNAMPLAEFSQAKARLSAAHRDKDVVTVVLDVNVKNGIKRLVFEMRGGGPKGNWYEPPLNGKIVAESKVKINSQKNLWEMSKMLEADKSF